MTLSEKGTGKTVRLATAFTGAAALATAFGPTAMAATAQPGYHPARANTGRGGIHPDHIRSSSHCGGGTSDWVHLAFATGTNDACYGGIGIAGSHGSLSKGLDRYCGGNNHGRLHLSDSITNSHRWINFTHGTTYAQTAAHWHISEISITGYGGNYHCPPPS